MKKISLARITLLLLCLLICIGILCSCMSKVASDDKEAVKSAVKRKASLRSDEEIAKTGLSADDVLAAFDHFLIALEEKQGGEEEVRFLSVTGEEVDVSLEERVSKRQTIEYYSPYCNNFFNVCDARQYAEFDHDVSYYVISVRETRKSIMGTHTANVQLSIPLGILEPVLSAFGAEKIEYRMANDLIEIKSSIKNGLFVAGNPFGLLYYCDYYWHTPGIGESAIREASGEQLEILYTFANELYAVVIDEDYSKFAEYVSPYYELYHAETTPTVSAISSDDLSIINNYKNDVKDKSEMLCTAVKLDESDKPTELCFSRGTNGKYVYSYDENGNLTGITQLLYTDHGILENTNEIALENSSGIVVHFYPKNITPTFSSSYDSIISIIPEKIGYQSDATNTFYRLDESHPADSVLIYGYHVVILVDGEQVNEGYIDLHNKQWPLTFISD